ncbi:MBOAT family O-acyltransferase [Mariniflexile aquimaris]|uniref:MBOAT family O-acyltransferase n=1 Tax=Mariniflexile aquimaris TaxID=881009 RepID=A0ABW3BTS2_9FLAO
MIFNSIEFFIFLGIVYFLYWFVFKKHLKAQNILLLVVSYVFYGWWDWRFLSLILLSTVVDYYVALRIDKNNNVKERKQWLWVSVVFNIGLLGFFKYYNFFIESWVDMFAMFGYQMKSTWTLKVILPVGISFYTFQTMSYSFDVYYKKLKPTTDFLSFAAFVSFFPQLVAGPIERASNLLPQILNKRVFNYAQSVAGLKLILWGLFKKVVIADSLGYIVDDIFANYSSYPASTLVIGVVFFSFQIYGDFSGYSDIAIGTSKLFGVELMSNFKFPYFARSIGEFWRRWHISLTTWFRDYLYIPMGGSQTGQLKSIRNVFIIFLVSGFWHGANWTFLVWGVIHACLFIPSFIRGTNRIHVASQIGTTTKQFLLVELPQIVLTFLSVTVTWIFFRAASITEAFSYIKGMVSNFSYQAYAHPLGYRMLDYYVLVIIFVFYEFLIREDERAPFKFKYKVVRLLLYTAVIFLMMLFYESSIDRSFIYFQF